MYAHNRPCAAAGLTSYRYRLRHGFVMIGANGAKDALVQARRSTDSEVTIDNLEIWNGSTYEKVQA